MGYGASQNRTESSICRTLVRRRHHSPLPALVFSLQTELPDLVAILGERGLSISHTTICVGSFAMLKLARSAGTDSSDRWVGAGELMKHSSRCEAS